MRKFKAARAAVFSLPFAQFGSRAGLAHFLVAMAHDDLGFLLIELGEFRTRRMVDPQQFVELGVQRQIVAPVGPLDEQRHDEHRQRRHRIPVEAGAVEDQPQHGVEQYDKEGGGMFRRLPDMRGPVFFKKIR
jgi:hypothetical protein